jgi:peptidoglycan/LPS O-acetylase OafA/YrhL
LSKINYRPEIDGLRAIAVTAVILYHAEFSASGKPLFSGGFLGVDVFFVISGYLISAILLKELQSTNRISFANFYERRARRILPALFVVMLASYPFAYAYLLPTAFTEFAKSILYTLGFSSNFYFHFSGLEYGSTESNLLPFLHTWSLSVEEQFYFLFPIVLWVASRYARKHLLKILGIGILLSLIAAEWGSKNYRSANFYLLHSRMWELLAGAFLAALETKRGSRNPAGSTLPRILPTIGLALIGLSITFFDDQMPHPSLLTAIPIVGICLVIWFAGSEGLATKLLSSRACTSIGLISYSLYLWHYPIFAFGRMASSDPGTADRLVWIALTLILSVLSYLFVEKVVRQKSRVSTRTLLASLPAVCVVLIAMSSFVQHKNGELNEANVAIQHAIDANAIQTATAESRVRDGRCIIRSLKGDFDKDPDVLMNFSNCVGAGKKAIVVLGDSHSIDLFNSVNILSSHDFILGLTKGGCHPPGDPGCQYDAALTFIEKHKDSIRVILFTHKGSYLLTDTSNGKHAGDSRWRKWPPNHEQIQKTLSYISKLKALVPNTIWIGPHIEANVPIDAKIFEKIGDKEFMRKQANFDLARLDTELKEIAAKNGLSYVSKVDAIQYDCEHDFYRNNQFLFSDTDHWSTAGEIFFGKKLFSDRLLREFL